MSSRLAGKGACACAYGQVSNIRLRPSLRVDIGATYGPKPNLHARLRLIRRCEARFFTACAADPPMPPIEHAATSDDRHRDRGKRDPDFHAIYRAEAKNLLRYFIRRLGNADDAEDLTQETLTRYLRATPGTRVETPQAYLRTIANNLLRDRAERSSTKLAKMSAPLDEGLDRPAADDVHRDVANRQELDYYRMVLSKLKPITLQIFLMHRVDGYTHQEIAERLGKNIWSVKRQMVKAIAHLDRHRRQP
ncbi:RNA polymerase sigma factor [Sphingomonas sp. BIUV-7]|uniref:RNA polymerase sigma factor n=1 Tax=Sphingomonas natans TaxID=3063330 RepID=A0ABT8YC66_9SPHN|nr:RNA polymerase sigma factor [Sphingomonas sp. BIUV-7]MDO6415423.1 RNA polymerase sigma factor [Sphingomonas sp. BIUV-7]